MYEMENNVFDMPGILYVNIVKQGRRELSSSALEERSFDSTTVAERILINLSRRGEPLRRHLEVHCYEKKSEMNGEYD